jgi:hypothetical protein
MLSLHLRLIKSLTFLVLFVLIVNGLGIDSQSDYSSREKAASEETIEITEEAIVSEKHVESKKRSNLVGIKKVEVQSNPTTSKTPTPDLFTKTSRSILHRALLI